jgi:hypothetical protein
VHLILPAGGYDAQEQEWHPINTKYLLPWKNISSRFKGKLIEALALKFKKGKLKMPPERKPFKDVDAFKRWLQGQKNIHWRIDITKPYGQSTGAMDYMARYVNRTAIGNNRIIDANKHEVLIKTRDRAKDEELIVKVTPKLFLQRFFFTTSYPKDLPAFAGTGSFPAVSVAGIWKTFGISSMTKAHQRHWRESKI